MNDAIGSMYDSEMSAVLTHDGSTFPPAPREDTIGTRYLSAACVETLSWVSVSIKSF